MTAPHFVEIHVLQPVPFANLNRDDLGSPKIMIYGGVERTRVSSQSWKRPIRHEVESVLGDRALRTRRVAGQIAARLREHGVDDELARAAGQQVLISAGLKVENDPSISSALIYLPESTMARLTDLVAEHLPAVRAQAGKKKPDKVLPEETVRALLTERNLSISMFGRMHAELAGAGVDGAVQVAHAFTTHATNAEIDFFTAVDDVPGMDAGSAHMNSAEFAAGVFYRYACLDVLELVANLDGDQAAAVKLTHAFLRAFLSTMPGGKRTATAPHTLPELVYVAVRGDRPLSLAGAFERPVPLDPIDGYGQRSRAELARYAERIHTLWGADGIVSHGHASIDDESYPGLGERHPSYPGLLDTSVTAAFGEGGA